MWQSTKGQGKQNSYSEIWFCNLWRYDRSFRHWPHEQIIICSSENRYVSICLDEISYTSTSTAAIVWSKGHGFHKVLVPNRVFLGSLWLFQVDTQSPWNMMWADGASPSAQFHPKSSCLGQRVMATKHFLASWVSQLSVEQQGSPCCF